MAASALAFKPVVKAAWRAPVRRGDLLLDVWACRTPSAGVGD